MGQREKVGGDEKQRNGNGGRAHDDRVSDKIWGKAGEEI